VGYPIEEVLMVPNSCKAVQFLNKTTIHHAIVVNFDKFMFAYTYSQLSGAVKFDNGGYHQITLGIDLFCKPVKYDCNCPAIN
jgi:hypothetical protein